MKGFKKDGKFRPTGNKSKSSLTKADIREKHAFKLNKGLKQLARQSALSLMAKGDNIVVLEKFDFEAPKTQEFVKILKALELDNKKSLFVLEESNNNVYLSSRNFKNTKVVKSSELSTYNVLNANKVVLSEDSLEGIESKFSK